MYPVVMIKPGYIEAIRNDLVWRFLVAGLFRTLAVVPLVLVLVVALVALLASTWTLSDVLAWTGWMSLGLTAAPFAFCAAVAFGFFLLARTRALLTLLATGLFLAVIPPLVNYAVGGETSTTVIITSVVTGMAGILSTAVAELVKKRPSAAEADKP